MSPADIVVHDAALALDSLLHFLPPVPDLGLAAAIHSVVSWLAPLTSGLNYYLPARGVFALLIVAVFGTRVAAVAWAWAQWAFSKVWIFGH
jgi:hypothetical protein